MLAERPLMIAIHAQMAVQTLEKAQELAFFAVEEQPIVRIDLLAIALEHSELGRTAPIAASVRRATSTLLSPRRIRHQPQTWTVDQILPQSALLDNLSMNSTSASQNLPVKGTLFAMVSQESSTQNLSNASAEIDQVTHSSTATLIAKRSL
jgi:hypothetical protein